MYYSNHFAYLISYHILINTVPSNQRRNFLCSNNCEGCNLCVFVPQSHSERFAARIKELEIWSNLALWDAETAVAHMAYRTYIGPDTRTISILQYSKAHNARFLNDVESNIWYTPKIRETIFRLFAKTHRTFGALKLALKLWRIRRATTQVSCDLYMTPLDTHNKYTFHLFQENNVFLFSLTDLTNIVVSSITHHNLLPFADSLDHRPKIIKNPYNNIPLTKSDLYNIYFQSQRAFLHVNETFRRFFLCDFNIYKFAKENGEYIESIGIKTLFKNTPALRLPFLAREMFAKYASYFSRGTMLRFRFPQIHARFPDRVLKEEMRPYLELYFFTLYSVYNHDGYVALMKQKMLDLMRQNPRFGQPIYSRIKDAYGIESKIVGFNDWVPPYVDTSAYFSTTHLYDDATNNIYQQSGDQIYTYNRALRERSPNYGNPYGYRTMNSPPSIRRRDGEDYQMFFMPPTEQPREMIFEMTQLNTNTNSNANANTNANANANANRRAYVIVSDDDDNQDDDARTQVSSETESASGIFDSDEEFDDTFDD